MKTNSAVIGVVLAACLLATGCIHHHHHSQPVVVEPETTAGGPVGTDPVVDMFYNDLAPYGEWIYIDGPGWVWSPYDVGADWRPYQYGHWVYTDYGWTWASDEEYGWAVYHYGRWHHAPRYGWVWVPGSEWGPAWVAWQESDDWVGWAPLPYHVRWRAGIGLDWGHSSVHVSIQSGHWSFVATRNIVQPHVHRHVVPRSHNTTYINVTKHVTNYTYIDNRVINRSVHVKNVNKAIGHPVHKHRVRHADKPGRSRGGRNKDDDLVIYRPREHPGREPQRRDVPPGHGDEHRGKKDRQGKQNDQGKNDRDERPAADRSGHGSDRDDNKATHQSSRPQRSGRDAEPDERPATNRGRGKNRDEDRGRADRKSTADGSSELKKVDPDRTNRKQSDQQREEKLRNTRPARESQRPSKPVPLNEKPGNRKSGEVKSGSGKENQGDAKRGSSGSSRSGSQASKSSKSKDQSSKEDNSKDGKSKQDDPEDEDEDEDEDSGKKGKKGSKKRGS